MVANKRPQPEGAEIDVTPGDAKVLVLAGKAEVIKRIPALAHLPPIKKATRRRKPKTIED